MRQEFIAKKRERSESNGRSLDFLEPRSGNASVEFSYRMPIVYGLCGLEEAEALKDAADLFPRRSERWKITRIKPVIEAPPIVGCHDQESSGPEDPRHFAGCLV